MLINYDIQKINTTLQNFYNATGIYMDLLRTDFSSVSDRKFWANNLYCKCIQETEAGKKACRLSDTQLLCACRDTKQIQMHVCHAGLIDITVPILHANTLLGYIVFGQLRTDTDFSSICDYVVKLGLDASVMHSYYSSLPIYDSEKIQSVSAIAGMLAKHILLENMLKPSYDENLQKTLNYINENLSGDLSIKSISKGAGVSKSVLYKRFHACFNCTVSEYVNEKRIEKAITLLSNPELSMEDISLSSGFSSAAYFSKTFKKYKGISPLKYKKFLHK